MNVETTLENAIEQAKSCADQSMLPQTVYRSQESVGWWHTSTGANILLTSELFVTILPNRFFH